MDRQKKCNTKSRLSIQFDDRLTSPDVLKRLEQSEESEKVQKKQHTLNQRTRETTILKTAQLESRSHSEVSVVLGSDDSNVLWDKYMNEIYQNERWRQHEQYKEIVKHTNVNIKFLWGNFWDVVNVIQYVGESSIAGNAHRNTKIRHKRFNGPSYSRRKTLFQYTQLRLR